MSSNSTNKEVSNEEVFSKALESLKDRIRVTRTEEAHQALYFNADDDKEKVTVQTTTIYFSIPAKRFQGQRRADSFGTFVLVLFSLYPLWVILGSLYRYQTVVSLPLFDWWEHWILETSPRIAASYMMLHLAVCMAYVGVELFLGARRSRKQ